MTLSTKPNCPYLHKWLLYIWSSERTINRLFHSDISRWWREWKKQKRCEKVGVAFWFVWRVWKMAESPPFGHYYVREDSSSHQFLFGVRMERGVSFFLWNTRHRSWPPPLPGCCFDRGQAKIALYEGQPRTINWLSGQFWSDRLKSRLTLNHTLADSFFPPLLSSTIHLHLPPSSWPFRP